MKTLAINSIAHFFTDAVCAVTLYGAVKSGGGDFAALLLLYNTLAFSTQCVVGLVLDRLRRLEGLGALGLLLCCMGALLPLDGLMKVIAVGLGNSLFHVAAGAVTLRQSGGRAGPLGVFVAPGAVGLCLGSVGIADELFAVAGLAVCAMMLFSAPEGDWIRPPARPVPWLAAAALLMAVAVRAVGGTAVSFPWKTGAALAVIMSLTVASGKAAGGYICDRWGPRKSSLLSVPAAALLIALLGGWMLPGLTGQLLLNLSMPVTLWLLYRAMPDSPALAFGLAAAALWPGTLLGQLISLTGGALAALVIVCFLLGLGAIIYADKKILEVSP